MQTDFSYYDRMLYLAGDSLGAGRPASDRSLAAVEHTPVAVGTLVAVGHTPAAGHTPVVAGRSLAAAVGDSPAAAVGGSPPPGEEDSWPEGRLAGQGLVAGKRQLRGQGSHCNLRKMKHTISIAVDGRHFESLPQVQH